MRRRSVAFARTGPGTGTGTGSGTCTCTCTCTCTSTGTGTGTGTNSDAIAISGARPIGWHMPSRMVVRHRLCHERHAGGAQWARLP
ncbi:hypothetical protein GCM10009080_23380 [Cupriavidus pauculus]